LLFSLPETLQQTPSSDAEDGDDDYDGDFIVTTGTPHPGWQPGDLQPHPYLDLKDEEGEDNGDGAATASDAEKAERTRERVRKALLAAPRHFVDPSKTAGSVLYPLVISAFVPRPIALVSTLSPSTDEKTGKRSGNLAPFSYAGLVSHDPPHVALGVCFTSGKPDRLKDTLYNILETKEFVVNSTSSWFVESLNHTCGFFDRGVDELELAGLTPQASVRVAPPRVAEAAVQLECRLVASHPVFSRSADPDDDDPDRGGRRLPRPRGRLLSHGRRQEPRGGPREAASRLQARRGHVRHAGQAVRPAAARERVAGAEGGDEGRGQGVRATVRFETFVSLCRSICSFVYQVL
jgi:flavin reductase (DIM6/NTAB) family NADH-FMN oxidoreductase RutF